MAAAVIILSHSISFQPEMAKKVATEKSDENSDEKTTIHAPAEALTPGSTVQINEQVPESVIETIPASDNSDAFIPPVEKIVNKFFSVLFERLIAPNAP